MKTALTITFCAITMALCSPITEAGKLYRWVDDAGKVHYSDKVPSSAVGQARSKLNEQGVEVERVEAAKTPEERARAAELARLRAEQERLVAKHKEEDRVLLRTFRSEDDIVMSMNGKLTALDVIIQVDHSNSKHTKAKLSELQGIAANQERQGKKVSTKLLAEIDSTRQQLHDIYQNILRREQEKKDIRKKGAADLKRFRTLKKLDQTAQPKVEVAKFKASLLETVVVCKDKSRCDALWTKAEQYIRKHATTPLDLLGDTVMMSKPPREDNDVSITISRIKKAEQANTLIFLDLQCKPSSEGKDFCTSEPVSQIRSGFRGALGATSEEGVVKPPTTNTQPAPATETEPATTAAPTTATD